MESSGRILDSNKELESLRQRFDSYCKQTMRYLAHNIADSATRRMLKEQPASDEVIMGGIMENVQEEPLEYGSVTVSAGCAKVSLHDEELAGALMRLQERKREILLLNEVLGYSLSEIADALRLSYETVKSTKSKAIRELRRGGAYGKES